MAHGKNKSETGRTTLGVMKFLVGIGYSYATNYKEPNADLFQTMLTVPLKM